MRRSGSRFCSLIVLAIPLWLGACGGDKPTKSNLPLTDEQAIRAMFAEMKAKTEAHDLNGFMACLHPDYLHNGVDRSQFRDAFSDPDHGLSEIRTILFDITGVTVNGNEATISARIAVTFLSGETDIVVEPEPGGGFGAGWLARSGDRWLVIGDRKHCGANVAVGHTDQTPPNDYFLTLSVSSETTEIVEAVATGPGISPTSLGPDPHDPTVWFASVTPPERPAVGDAYTFRVNYGDGKADTLNLVVRGMISFLPWFTVTPFSPGTARVDWPDSSAQVPEASHYRIWARALEEPDPWGSDDIPLNHTSYAMTGLTPGRGYEFRLIIFDHFGNQAYRSQWATVP
jgi:hypothetical protein